MARRTKKNTKDERVRLVEELIEFGVQGLEDSGVIRNYNRGLRYWRGDHDIRSRDKSLGNKVYNKFAETLETLISHLTDARPKWVFRPQSQEDILISHALNQIVGDVVWDYIDWDQGEDGGGKGEESLLQASFAGSSHIKTVFDIDTGYPNFIVIPAGSIIVDPKAKKKRQLRYWIHLTSVPVEVIKRRYGVDVQPQADLEKLRSQNRADFHRPQITGQLDTVNDKFPSAPFRIDKGSSQSVFGNDPLGQAVVAECWMQDFSLEQIPFDESEVNEEHEILKSRFAPEVKAGQHHKKHIEAHEKFKNTLDPNTESELINELQDHIDFHKIFPQETTRRKYPFGRVITTCQGKLLSDRSNPFDDVGLDYRDVLIKYDYHINPEAYWGKPLTADKFDPQDDLNHRKNAITQNINRLNVGIRKIKWNLYDKLGLKNNPRRLNNLPGNVVPFINSPDEFTTDYGTPMPSQIWTDIAWTMNFMDGQSNDAASGRLPAAGTANVTLETLLGEFKTILRKPLRHYASALAEMGRNAVLIMAKRTSPDERFLILGEDQQTFQEIRWGDISNKAALMRNVRIDTANLLPTSRMETFRKVIEMMQSGVPPEAAIQLLDDPKAIQIMQTMSQINQLTAALEQMSQENQQLKQEVNTITNRLQGSGGVGNAGVF